ncbi:MAG: hypothetical protein Q9P14_14665 [candidate division KSB1 bacterium]|nr:hypothetical protein [candidate division KSB1 bacterium]
MSRGEHALIWDAKNDRGELLPAGVYFIQLVSGSRKAMQKVYLIK